MKRTRLALALGAALVFGPALGVGLPDSASGGTEVAAGHELQCRRAYTRQDLDFLLAHCRFEAWSLARAQCERTLDSISPRYAAFCKAFGRE
ncbi:MAG: hypothetical protein PHD37_05675 [Gallionellaceae bacterium]|nr:hypothetical protein [Gallionellaceae bacterium]